jgi:23S rRNA-/tRNA-specific pseudouridylate synthase
VVLQVRVVQQGQVKRASQTRNLLPGDILLLPKQLQRASKRAAPASAAVTSSSSESDVEYARSTDWTAGGKQQQQQQQQLDPQLLQEQQEVEQQMEQELQQLEQQQQQQQQWQGNDLWQQQQPGVLWQQQQRQQLERTQQQQQQQQHRQRDLTVQQIRRWVLASSADIAVLSKPPGVSFHQGSANNHRALNPVLAEALNIRPPERPYLICGLDDRASGCTIVARHAAADEWLSAWVAGEPAAIAAAAAMAAGSASGDRRGGVVQSRRVQQQQQKLQRIAAAAAAAAEGGKKGAAAAAAAGFAPQELQGMQQLLEGLGGLRLRRLFWAVVQADLPVRSSGTLRNRCV